MIGQGAERRRMVGRVGLILLAAVLPNLVLVLARFGAPADGTGTFPSAPPWGDGVVVAAVAGHAGDLQVGDRVLAVDGVALDRWVSTPGSPGVREGQVLTYLLRRGDQGAAVPVTVTLGRYPLWEIARARAALHPLLVILLAVGGYVFLRRPRDPAARALFRIAALVPAGLLAFPYSTQVVDVLTGRLWPLVLSDGASLLMWGAVLHFALVFPEPWGISARWPRRAAAAAYGLPIVLYGLNLAWTLPGQDNALARLGALVTISVPAADVVPPLTGMVLVAGYLRNRDAPARRRLRWVLGSLVLGFVGYLLLGRLPEWVAGSPLVPWDWQTLFFVPFPLAIAAAVLRYQLFDLQIILRRSLVYGGLVAVLAGIYLGLAAGIGVISGTAPSVGPLLAGAAVVVLVLALRERLRAVTLRLVFGHRDDPYEVVRQLGLRLQAAGSADSILHTVAATLARALRLPYVALELTGAQAPGASVGERSGQPRVIPLVHLGEEVGRLVLDTGPLREPFGEADERLLDGIARQVGMTAHNVLLTARLRRSLERVVLTREEERRRLRRDIHDGVGPTLASAAMRLDVARRLLRPDPDAAESVLDSLAQAQRQALDDLRRMVEGLRPPALDQLGLAGAVRERVGRLVDEHATTMSVRLEVPDRLGPLPAAVEVAAYHIVSEALTNALRHSRAAVCVIRLRCADGLLRIEVADDGAGLPERYRAGVGLTSMRERATELGGTARARAAEGGGTVVSASLPVPGEPGELGPAGGSVAGTGPVAS